MLYSEFIKGTKATESKETYEQYRILEKIYMSCESMSKEQIYALWKKTYGKEMKLKKKRMHDRACNLLICEHDFRALPESDQNMIIAELDRMFWNAFYNKDQSRVSYAPSGMSYTDGFGIVWFLKHVANHPNGSRVFGLYANVDGELMDAHYRR